MMEISGSGGAGNAALLHQWRERLFARTEKEASDNLTREADSAAPPADTAVAPANPAEAPATGPGDPEAGPEAPPGQTRSLSDQMLGVLFGAQGAGGGETEVAARLAAMLERALKAYQPDQATSRPGSA
ncbi:hypothetical protein [Falsiroseomonas sp.]|uniref:hypothetical protein n=1 Tax=Falsiroseomonas sp. TaxID=2870721 RepID=UPI002736FFB3|nr:hypothetical protein [Falsiroseomonas sp.]MDP3415394.1 hypothetical protein [Falsiroseomonas sp.]